MLMVRPGIMLKTVIRFSGKIINLLPRRSSNCLSVTAKAQNTLMIVSVYSFKCLPQTFATARMTVRTIQNMKMNFFQMKK